MNERIDVSFSLLTAFVAVARELHFGRAAEMLGSAQPALSQQVRNLETIIGCRLLERDTRNVSLTPAGLALQELSTRILSETREGLDRVRRIGRGETGQLTVGFTATMALETLPTIMGLQRQRYPGVEIDLIEAMPDDLYVGLHSGRMDIAFSREMLREAGLNIVDLAREPYVAVLPQRLDDGDAQCPLALSRLASHPFILFPSALSSANTQKIFELCAQGGFAPTAGVTVTSWQSAIGLVGVGLGVTLLPKCTSRLRIDNVAFRSIESNIMSQIGMAHRRDESRPVVLNFIQCAREAMPQDNA